MAQTLCQFVDEQRKVLLEFKAWWIKKNAETPDRFPLTMPDDNDGLWIEMLLNFTEFKNSDDCHGFYD